MIAIPISDIPAVAFKNVFIAISLLSFCYIFNYIRLLFLFCLNFVSILFKISFPTYPIGKNPSMLSYIFEAE